MANATSTVVGVIEVDSSCAVDATFEELISMLAHLPKGGVIPKAVSRKSSGARARSQGSGIWNASITVLTDTRQVEEDFQQEYVDFNRRLSVARASR